MRIYLSRFMLDDVSVMKGGGRERGRGEFGGGSIMGLGK